MRLYLAGPMRGIPDFNFPLFNEVSLLLRSEGHVVFNPAERDTKVYGELKSPEGKLSDIQNTGFDLREALAEDLYWICKDAEGIVLLPGWENSKGAKAEKATAKALGLRVFYFKDGRLVTRNEGPVLKEGLEVVIFA